MRFQLLRPPIVHPFDPKVRGNDESPRRCAQVIYTAKLQFRYNQAMRLNLTHRDDVLKQTELTHQTIDHRPSSAPKA